MEKFNRKEYMEVYNKEYYRRKSPPTSRVNDYIENPYTHNDLFIQPTLINFKGSEKENPKCCEVFGCGRHLSITELLAGNRCINHQQKQKIQPSDYISYPIKNTA